MNLFGNKLTYLLTYSRSAEERAVPCLRCYGRPGWARPSLKDIKLPAALRNRIPGHAAGQRQRNIIEKSKQNGLGRRRNSQAQQVTAVGKTSQREVATHFQVKNRANGSEGAPTGENQQGHVVILENLSKDVSLQAMKDYLGEFGKVVDCVKVNYAYSGTIHARMDTAENCEWIMECLHNSELCHAGEKVQCHYIRIN